MGRKMDSIIWETNFEKAGKLFNEIFQRDMIQKQWASVSILQRNGLTDVEISNKRVNSSWSHGVCRTPSKRLSVFANISIKF